MKPNWAEWAKLVQDHQAGKDYALKIIFEKSRKIIEGVVSKKNQIYSNRKGFALDPDDIFQEIASKLPQKIMGIRKPQYYPRWLHRTTENECFKELKKLGREFSLETIAGSEESRDRKLNGLEDRRRGTADSFSLLHEFENDFSEKDYKKKAIIQMPKLKKGIKGTATEIEYYDATEGFEKWELLIIILGKALVDKQEYKYPEAEKKLQAILELTRKKRLTYDLKYLRAKAFTELGHLKMNEGLVSGGNGSIFYYTDAQELWNGLKDKPNLFYASEQIGVSHYIGGDSSTARAIYESLIKEIPQSKFYQQLKANIYCDLSSANLVLRNMPEANGSIEESLTRLEDIGGLGLAFAKRQKAKIDLFWGHPGRAYRQMEDNLKRPPTDALEYVKDNILLFDLYMVDREKDDALALAPKIQAKCKDHLFHHQLQQFNKLLQKYHLV